MPTARFKARRDFVALQPAPKTIRRKPSIKYEAVPGAQPGPMPAIIAPQLATLVKAPPAGTAWVHEIKFDGYRMLGRIDNRDARIVSRNGKEWTEAFPGIAKALATLPIGNAWPDGEICVVDAKGRSSFQALQNVLSDAPGTLAIRIPKQRFADSLDCSRTAQSPRY